MFLVGNAGLGRDCSKAATYSFRRGCIRCNKQRFDVEVHTAVSYREGTDYIVLRTLRTNDTFGR